MTADSIHTTATVTMDKLEVGWTVTGIHLDVTAKIPGADPAKFQTAARNAETGCPISRLLKAPISDGRKARLKGGARFPRADPLLREGGAPAMGSVVPPV